MAYGGTVPHIYVRVCLAARRRAAALGLTIIAVMSAVPATARTDPIKATVEAKVTDGEFAYARLIFTLSEYDDVRARIANGVLIISFQDPIAVVVARIAAQIPEYVGAARTDPDGRGVRMALAKDVKVNATAAGEKLFVDLLPQPWTGPPPGLPQEVIEDLARRARVADRLEKEAAQQPAKPDAVRVHVATQPTFTRYVFDVPKNTTVSADRANQKLTLGFDAPIKFDLADAQAALPKSVNAIGSELKDASASVSFDLAGKVDVRTFRDDKGYVVDVVNADNGVEQPSAVLPAPQQSVAPDAQPPQTTPAVQLPKQGAIDGAGASVAAADKPDIAAPATISPADAQPAAPKEAVTPPVIPPLTAANSTPEETVTPPLSAPAEPRIEASAAEPKSPALSKADVQAAMPAVTPPSIATPPVADNKAAPHPKASDNGKFAVQLVHDGENLKLSFPFTTPTAAAIFQRADTLWIVFDTGDDIDLSALDGEPSHTIRSASLIRTPDADIVRIKFDHPHLSTVNSDGPVWTVQIGDSAIASTRALDLTRNLVGPNRSSVTVPFDGAHLVHHLTDPNAGDQLIVVTAYAPARGFINSKNFVEFRALASVQGVVVEPLADDVKVELQPDQIIISRPLGLALSASLQTLLHGSGLRPVMFDSQLWGFDRQSSYTERQSKLISAAAEAPDGKRLLPRLDLSRFYIARDMYPEAKGVLDVALTEEHPAAEKVTATVLRALTEIMINRPDDALKDLSDPAVGDQHDAPLWRALVYAREGKWGQARDGFKSSEASVATLPVELQRVALKDEMRSEIEVGDFNSASSQLNDFQTIGVPHDLEPAMSVLIGRLAEGMGRTEDALAAYRTAADSWDRRAAAQGELRETLLRYSVGDLKRDAVISELEKLTTIWRGDDTEIEALQMLARLYTDEGHYRDSFYVMRSALAARPNSDMTRRIQQEAAKTFDVLFLSGKGDALPAIDALALFYDFRELTPIGRRGDEMIRRLADRLVAVDLLDQAADLLQYQVDNRLQGAARAQVATRLAVIYLLNRKADRALATLRATRTADLSEELRNQRLLLEARALSDMGRHDLAIEVIGNVDGRQSIRLRSDIYWAARRWRESAEQIELLYGERWKDWQPLNEVERADILRAEVGYALGEDALGLDRFREKYAAKMAGTPDAHAFQIASAPLGASGAEFVAIAHAAAAFDTLDSFLRDMQTRYPDASPQTPPASDGAPAVSSGAPASGQLPGILPVGPEGPFPPARAAGRSAQL
jgi:hypothetical protein